MTSPRFRINLPLVIFLVAILSFAGWIAYEAMKLPPKWQPGRDPPPTAQASPGPSLAGPPPGPGGSADALVQELQLQRARMEVERLLMALPPPFVEPIDVSSGSPVVRLRYRVYITRYLPSLMPDIAAQDFQPGTYRLVLEFNGALRDHPLQSVRITPFKKN